MKTLVQQVGGRALFIIVLFSIILAVTNWITLLYGTWTTQQHLASRLPPYEVLQSTGTNEPVPVLCPGEMLTVRLTLRVTRAPTVSVLVETIWRSGIEVWSNPAPQWFVWTEPLETVRTVSLRVPSLPAGEYEARLAVSDLNNRPDVLRVPFVVWEDCE